MIIKINNFTFLRFAIFGIFNVFVIRRQYCKLFKKKILKTSSKLIHIKLSKKYKMCRFGITHYKKVANG